MAWKVKPSATMTIERRDQPYLDEAMRASLEKEVVIRYPNRQGATMPVLHAVQDRHGWLPMQAIEEIADFLKLPASTVLDTATFYEEYLLEKPGKYVIWICQSLSCELMGEGTLTRRIVDKLGIEPGQTTPDGRFTLRKVECLGSCGTAPVALVNHTLHEGVSAQTLEAVLDQLD